MLKEYKVKRISGKPDWASIEPINIGVRYRDTKDDVTAEAKFCYDDEGIFVHLSTTEPHSPAKGKDFLCEPCLDSCLEFFFSPVEGDERYMNIEFNPNGIYYFGIGTSIKTLVRLVPENRNVFGAKIKKRNDGWSITYKVPVEVVKMFFPNFSLYSGKVMRANCYKCVEVAEEPNFLAWNDIGGPTLNFHRPHLFGKFIFE